MIMIIIMSYTIRIAVHSYNHICSCCHPLLAFMHSAAHAVHLVPPHSVVAAAACGAWAVLRCCLVRTSTRGACAFCTAQAGHFEDCRLWARTQLCQRPQRQAHESRYNIVVQARDDGLGVCQLELHAAAAAWLAAQSHASTVQSHATPSLALGDACTKCLWLLGP